MAIETKEQARVPFSETDNVPWYKQRHHVVSRGESMFDIARLYKVEVDYLCSLNRHFWPIGRRELSRLHELESIRIV